MSYILIAAAVFSGFFSLASYSLRTYRRIQLEEAFGEGRGGERLSLLRRNLRPLRLAVSLCRSMANLVLIVAMLYWMDAPSHGSGRVILAATAAGTIIAVVSVAIPHAWAYYAGERFLAAMFLPLMALRYVLFPLTAVMRAFEMPIRHLSGSRRDEATAGESAREEILHLASQGRDDGDVAPEEGRMIRSVIELSSTRAAQAMTPRTDIRAISLDTPWDETCRQVARAGHPRLPVYEGDLDNIVGILYAKDLLGHVGEVPPPSLKQVMRKPFFVPETKPLGDLLREFKTRKVHIAVVLDEYGGTAGLLTIDDVLEEVLGDMPSEHERTAAAAAIRRIDHRTAEVDGRTRIDELNDELDIELPLDAGYDTVAGLIFSELGYVPSAGEKLQAHGAEFTVLSADERRIIRARITLPDDRQPDETP